MHEWCLMSFSIVSLGCFNCVLRGFNGCCRCILRVFKRLQKVFKRYFMMFTKNVLGKKKCTPEFISLYIYFHQNHNSLSILIIIGLHLYSAVHIHQVQDVPCKRRRFNHNAIYFLTYPQMLPTI